MAEEVQEVTAVQEHKNDQTQDVDASARLAAAMFGDAPVATQQTAAAQAEPQVQATATEAQTEEPKAAEEILDDKDYLKRFGWENEEVGLKEINELRELKSKKQDDAKFTNDESKLIYEHIAKGNKKEVRQFLETQERLEALTTTEVNKDNAEEIIKLGMHLKYKSENLTQREIDYKYNKQFSIPREPKQTDLESDEDFSSRKQEWQEQVSDIEMSKIIEAKLAKPELSKAKSELVLPEINKEVQAQQAPTQEQLDAFEKDKTSFIQSAQQALKNFNGFSVQVKDKDVDYTVSYAPSQEEKTLVTTQMQRFAESGFNANALLADRWVMENGALNTEQIQKDLFKLYTEDKAMQKVAMDSKGKAIEAFVKEKKRIDINGGTVAGTFDPSNATTAGDALRDAMLRV